MRVLKQLRQWMHLSRGRVLVGHAEIEKADVLPHWNTCHIPTKEETKMIPAHVLSFDPSNMPIGSVILIYYPKD